MKRKANQIALGNGFLGAEIRPPYKFCYMKKKV